MNEYTYTMPHDECLSDDTAANIAFFLLENTGTTVGTHETRITVADQIKLFNVKKGTKLFGRRSLKIIGSTETIYAYRKVCFGTDFEVEQFNFSQL